MQHGIEDDEEFPHAGREHELGRLALGQEPGSEGTNDRVVLLGTQRSHVESVTDALPASPDGTATPELAAVPVEWSHPHEGRHPHG